jgi:hypothetical protein
MEPLSTALIAIFIPSLAVALNLGIKHLMRDKKKTIIISKPYGHDETIRVGALADDAKVLNIVRRTIGFEDDVYKAILNIAEEVSGLKVRRDRLFDFVVEYKNHRFAVECKYNLGRSSVFNLYQLLENSKDLEKLFVITRQHMKSQQMEKPKEESSSSRIDFISIGAEADIQGTLNSLIRHEIDLPITA